MGSALRSWLRSLSEHDSGLSQVHEEDAEKRVSEAGVLPNFCANRTVFLVVIAAELLAIVLALASFSSGGDFWLGLALVSLYVQWVGLTSVALLCWLGPFINRLGPLSAVALAYLLTQLVTLAFSGGSMWLLRDGLYGELVGSDSSGLLFRSMAISSIVFLALMRYFYIQQRWKENVEAEARAQFQALQARIRPHFLFNSLNTIASLIRQRPEQAEEAVMDLADLFRFTLAQRDRIRLYEELDVARHYLRIEGLRLGERLQVEWSLPDDLPLDKTVPALILQPLVENAVYHGIQPGAVGILRIKVEAEPHRLVVSVSNPVPSQGVASSGNRIAQDNIRQRLQLAYGSDSTLAINEGGGQYQVSFSIPR